MSLSPERWLTNDNTGRSLVEVVVGIITTNVILRKMDMSYLLGLLALGELDLTVLLLALALLQESLWDHDRVIGGDAPIRRKSEQRWFWWSRKRRIAAQRHSLLETTRHSLFVDGSACAACAPNEGDMALRRYSQPTIPQSKLHDLMTFVMERDGQPISLKPRSYILKSQAFLPGNERTMIKNMYRAGAHCAKCKANVSSELTSCSCIPPSTNR